MGWFDTLLYPLMVVVAWIMVQFHSLLSWLGLDPASGAAWAGSIIGLVIVIRILLIPLFFRQIKASRGMQMLAPQMKEIQKKYKGKTDPASREAMSRETMALYREHGTNPFASCLPILLQSPIFFALFRVLYSLHDLSEGSYHGHTHIGPLNQALAGQAESATVFGAPLSGSFLGSTDWHTKVVTIVLIVAMCATTFLTQRQLTMKNMPPSAKEGPMAQQQKVLIYVFPLIFAFSGVNFPIGVLIYWTTTNLWSMGQQFYTIRRMPAPGSDAEIAYKARQERKAQAHGGTALDEGPSTTTIVIDEKPRGQRVQPKRKDRAKGPGGVGSGAAPAAGVSDAAGSQTGAPKPGGSGASGNGRPQNRPAGTGSASGGSAKPGARANGGGPNGSGKGSAAPVRGAAGGSSTAGGSPAGGGTKRPPSSGASAAKNKKKK